MIKNAEIPQIQTDGKPKKQKTTKDKGKVKKELKTKACEFLEFGTKIIREGVILSLPIKTVSEANCFEPWQKKHKRHKLQKKLVFFAMIEIKHLIKLPCHLTFIRYASKSLDKHDNLPMSMKYICDQVCAELTGEHRAGRADDNELINITYDQVKSKVYGVKIIINF